VNKKTILFCLMMVFLLFGQAFCEETFDLRAIKADVEIVGTNDSMSLGEFVAAGDINGDGIDDIVATEICFGSLYIIYGDTALTGDIDLSISSADVTIEGAGNYWYGNMPMITFGDINGDGIEDLLIGSTCYEHSRVFAILGSVSMPSVINVDTYPDLLRVKDDLELIFSIGSGDFNGDGFDDIMISNILYYYLDVFVWFGAENLPTLFPPANLHIVKTCNWTTGHTSSSPTDFNGDGFDDIFFSYTKYLRPGYTYYSGTVWGIYGDSILPAWINLDSTAADIDIFQPEPYYFGMSIGAGNVNGDGFNDLIVRDHWSAAFVFYGNSLLPAVVNLADTSADVTIFDLSTSEAALATGDFNSDGYSDMLLGTKLIFGSESLPGELHLSSGFDGITIIGEEENDYLGRFSVGMGDFNGDGLDDLLLGAPGKNNPPMRGKVYVIFGDSVIHHGNPNYDKVTDIGDVVYLLNYLFKAGPVPYPRLAGDATCDGIVDVGDVVLLINYLFKSGPAPSC